MSEVLTVARARVDLLKRDLALGLFQKAFQESGIAELATAITLWESPSEPGSFLLVARYPDEATADKAQEVASQTGAFADIIQVVETAADIRRYRLAGQQGLHEFHTEKGACLSLSVRSADPGLGWDLNAELARILDEISMLPGFLGSMHGRSATVHEEVMSIALWKDEDAYRASVPSHHLFVLNAFTRVA